MIKKMNLFYSEIKNSEEIIFDTFYRQVRSWIYGGETLFVIMFFIRHKTNVPLLPDE